MKEIRLPKIDKKQKFLVAWKNEELGLRGSNLITFIAESKTKIYWYIWDGIAKNPSVVESFYKLKIDRIFQYDN